MASNTKSLNNYRLALKKTKNAIKKAMPSLLGVLMLVGIINQINISKLSILFTKNAFLDSLLGSLIGSIAAGNPITSYIIGGELLDEGVSLFAVTAFVLSWVTVGIVQFPAESVILGKRFAIIRNLSSFILAIAVSIAVVVSMGALG